MLLVHLFVCFVRVRFWHFSLLLGAGGWLAAVVILHSLDYSVTFCDIYPQTSSALEQSLYFLNAPRCDQVSKTVNRDVQGVRQLQAAVNS